MSDKDMLIVKAIAATPKTTRKLQLMKKMDRQVLYYAYNPDITFGIRPPFPKYYGTQELGAITWRILKLLYERKMTGNQARDLAQKYINTLTPKSATLFRRIMLKDLRCGISAKSVNKVFPKLLPTYGTMQPADWNPDKIRFPCAASFKYDGICGMRYDSQLWTRKGKLLKGLGHILRNGRSIKPDLVGELAVPGAPLHINESRVMSHKYTPEVKLHVFDTPSMPNLKFIDRQEELSKLLKGLMHIELIEYEICHNLAEADAFYEEALTHTPGIEGVVYKELDSFYSIGDTWDWMRRKKLFTFDVYPNDIYMGEGKYQYTMGGFYFMLNGVRCKCGGGFDDKLRAEWFENPEKILGHLVEVSAQEVTHRGRLRHVQFERFRFDK